MLGQGLTEALPPATGASSSPTSIPPWAAARQPGRGWVSGDLLGTPQPHEASPVCFMSISNSSGLFLCCPYLLAVSGPALSLCTIHTCGRPQAGPGIPAAAGPLPGTGLWIPPGLHLGVPSCWGQRVPRSHECTQRGMGGKAGSHAGFLTPMRAVTILVACVPTISSISTSQLLCEEGHGLGPILQMRRRRRGVHVPG